MVKSRNTVDLNMSSPRIRSVQVDAPQVVMPVRPGGFVKSGLLSTGKSAPNDTPAAAIRVREGGLVRAAKGGHRAVPGHLKNGAQTVPFVTERSTAMEVLNGLSRLVPALRATYDAHQRKEDEKTSIQAQRDYNLRGVNQGMEDITAFLEDKDEAYRTAYTALHGKVTGIQASEDILNTYGANKATIKDVEAFDALVKQKAEEYMGDVDDETFLQNFMPSFQTGAAKANSVFEKDQEAQLVNNTKDELYSSQVGDLRDAVEKGMTVPDVVAGLKQYSDAQEAGHLLMTSAEVRESTFEAVTNVARESDNANLLKALDAMGYGDDPEYHEKLLQAKDAVARSLKTRQASVNGVAKYDALMRIKASSEKGVLTEAEVRKAVSLKIISPESGSKLMFASKNKNLELRKKEVRKNMVLSGHGLQAKASMTNAEYVTAFEDAVKDIEGRVESKELDPATGRDFIMNMSAQSGMLPKKLKTQLNNAPVGSQAFVSAALQYKALKASNKELVGGEVSNQRAAQFDVYDLAISAGMTTEQAQERVRTIGDPKTLKVAEQKIKKALPEIRSIVIDELVDMDGTHDAHNNAYVHNTVKDHIKLLVSDGVTTPSEAAASAVARFKETHRFLPDSGGLFADGVWVDTRGRNIPVGMETAWQGARQDIAASLKGTNKADSAGYYIQPKPLDKGGRAWQVYGRSSGLPIVGVTIDIDKMMANEQLKMTNTRKQDAMDSVTTREAVERARHATRTR